jgi:hypothetical protein
MEPESLPWQGSILPLEQQWRTTNYRRVEIKEESGEQGGEQRQGDTKEWEQTRNPMKWE